MGNQEKTHRGCDVSSKTGMIRKATYAKSYPSEETTSAKALRRKQMMHLKNRVWRKQVWLNYREKKMVKVVVEFQ